MFSIGDRPGDGGAPSLGEPLAVEFANTHFAVRGRIREGIGTPQHLAGWLLANASALGLTGSSPLAPGQPLTAPFASGPAPSSPPIPSPPRRGAALPPTASPPTGSPSTGSPSTPSPVVAIEIGDHGGAGPGSPPGTHLAGRAGDVAGAELDGGLAGRVGEGRLGGRAGKGPDGGFDDLPDGGLILRPGLVDQLGEAEVIRFRELRDAIRAIAGAAVEDRRPAPWQVDVLNRAAGAAPRWPALVVADGGWTIATRTDGSVVPAALSAIARDAITLFGGPLRTDLRACQAPGCVLFFVKDHPRRAWCSGACGNRARAARHYRRHREA